MSDTRPPNTRQTRLAAYQYQIARLERRIAVLERRADRWSTLRLVIFLGGFIAATAASFRVGDWLFWLLAIITAAGFSYAVFQHRRLRRTLAQLSIWRNIKAAHIARLTHDWAHIPAPLFAAEDALAVDLDLVGERSVHHLIDTCVSYEGSARLRDWLLNTEPSAETIAYRQALVKELLLRPIFRDKLTLSATLSIDTAGHRLRVTPLLEWFTRHGAVQPLTSELRLMLVLAVVNAILLALNVLNVLPPLWVASLIVYYIVLAYTTHKMGDLFDEVSAVQDGLNKLGAVFSFLEKARYQPGSKLKALCAPFLDPVTCPSRYLKRIARIVSAASLRYNQMLWVAFNTVLPWDVIFAELLRHRKAELARLLPGWLDVWYELEALGSLTAVGYLNPGYTFPEVTSAERKPIFEAKAVGHPLLPPEQRVTNDFAMVDCGTIIVITGSNMAGKSTFLRTLGVNLQLAFAGAPVDAERFCTGLFRVFTCIRVTDSVMDGFSYFYAEVRRLKALLDALEQPHALPLFFLIDEIFRGTNNQERLIGSRSYIRALVGRNGLGAISTHDLELIKLANDDSRISNYHFREEVIDGKMVFDYKLRPGPSPTTNALKIMQLEGLPVEI